MVGVLCRTGRPTACALVILFAILLTSACKATPVEKRAEQQRAEWKKLYPKLNSKMARMEELLNFIDRFMDDRMFHLELQNGLREFCYLAREAQKDLPPLLPAAQVKPYQAALAKVDRLGQELSDALRDERISDAKALYHSLIILRRKSHTTWAP